MTQYRFRWACVVGIHRWSWEMHWVDAPYRQRRYTQLCLYCGTPRREPHLY